MAAPAAREEPARAAARRAEPPAARHDRPRPTRIRLLGRPVIERDGRLADAPRGRKAWALLGYLLLADRPQRRRHLADLMFGEAADPLGALRWSLAELRRALGEPTLFLGDPVCARLPAAMSVDLRAILDPSAEPLALLDADGDLLQGIHLPDSPEYEAWLVVERHRLAVRHEELLRAAAEARLAAGLAGDAIRYAAGAAARNPRSVANRDLLTAVLAAAGGRPPVAAGSAPVRPAPPSQATAEAPRRALRSPMRAGVRRTL
ncbi:hypothetical protein I6A94_29725 [Frankia sp. CN4]|uniref:hypothetical protein n=1 Tax=Frankia nepalensis TaxID=1836974 RepID=UPI001934804A|nr:hypothetical protein [Frankia nepalensis]MBL7513986.1 hypothetical protein [Frankia nepalensis]